MADSEIVIKILADTAELKEGVKKIGEETGKIKEIAGINIDNVIGKLFVLNEGWKAASEMIGKVGEIIQKVVIEMALLGEEALQVEHGFDRMAEGAGIAGDKLKEAMFKAADGTLETTEMLRRATELIAAFGHGAEKIPQLIELSRAVAKNFGKDSAETFDQISEAVRNGNTRLLKHYGIYIDAEKAVRKFALAHDVAVNSINQAGRSQAILDALLKEGDKKFDASSQPVRSLAESWKRLKNEAADAIENISIKIYQLLGPATKWMIDKLGDLTLAVKEAFGADTVKTLGEQIAALEKKLALFGKLDAFDTEMLKKKKAQLAEMEREEKESAERTEKAKKDAAKGNEEITDPTVKLKNEVAFQQQLNQIRMQAIEQQLQTAQTLEQVRHAQAEKEKLMMEQLAQKKKEIDQNEMLDSRQKSQMKIEQEHLTQQQLLLIREQYEAQELAAAERKMHHAKAFDDQVAASAEVQSRRTAMAWKQSGQLGGAAVSAFGKHTIQAFKAIGDGSKSAGDALKGAFFGMLGEMASMQGQFMFLSSIWPPNPLGMAAGLGLIALGSMLSSMGGGGSSASSGGDMGGGGGMGGFGSGMSSGPGVEAAAAKKKDVTINIEGNYFDSEQTRLSIVEAVRSASDGNDFTVQRGNRR